MRKPTDTDIVLRAQRGDQGAFAHLATEAYDRLHIVAHGILRDRERADDAIQQALLIVWRELPRLRDPGRFDAWSYRLLINVCYAEARSTRRWLPGIGPDGVDDTVAAGEIQAILDRDQLERGFRRLSVDHRAVLVLHYYMDMSTAQIADALGLPIGTVHSRMHHALRGLRAALDSDARSHGGAQGSAEGVR